MSTKPKALLLGKFDQYVTIPPSTPRALQVQSNISELHSAQKAWDSLGSIAELITPTATNRADFIEECKSGKLDGVVVAYRTFDSISITGLIDEELVNVLPKSLQFLAHCGISFHTSPLLPPLRERTLTENLGAGYDQVDVHACTARNPPLRVSNVPTAVDDATADVNMFLILGALRNFNYGMHHLRQGSFKGSPLPRLGHDPEGKVLGILGMGGIGRNLKKKAEAFGMKVVYHNRRRLSEELAGGAEYVSFEELLGGSDVISLNLPLNVGSLSCLFSFFSSI
jgi:D-3-phosphoglycerate dehydrogenase